MSFLNVSGISKKEAGNFILNGISFSQKRLQKIAIAGETGSGKSSLLKIIAGIIPPDEGEVMFENERVKKVPAEKLIPGHPGIAYLSQHFELLNNYRVEEILEYANNLPAKDAASLYKICRIDHLLKRKTHQLSGGEKQRIALARLLVSSPRLLLLDEPFSNLDMIHKSILKSVIRDVGEQLKITCILVSHDPLDSLSWADEIFIMKAGQIIQQGTAWQVYNRPVNEYAAALLGKYNILAPATAAIFYQLPGIKTSRKYLFIRPEHIAITKNDAHAITGAVQNIIFFGGYYEVELLISENTTIIINTLDGNIKKGDMVNVTPDPKAVWYFE